LVALDVAHKLVFYLLYLFFFLSTAVFIERLLYYFFTFPTERKLLRREASEEDELSVEILYHTYASKIERGKGLLLFVITASPLVGLLGTVIGIMDSFSKMAERGISDVATVGKGISFALEATALGIFVSVISLIYYYIVNALSKSAKEKLKKAILEGLKSKS
jgi:biopolymer transport protein ExbB